MSARRALVAFCCAAVVASAARPTSGEDGGLRGFVNAKVVPAAFSRAVAALRKRTLLPIVMPSKIDAGVFAQIEAASNDSYVLDTGLAPDCGGAHACGWFTLSAARAKPVDALWFGERVSLGRGVDGDLSPPRMTAYPTDTVIAWHLGSSAYTLSVNSHGPNPAALARSIVANLITLPPDSRLTTAPERAPLAAKVVAAPLAPGVAELRRVSQLPIYLPVALPKAWAPIHLTVDEPSSAGKGDDTEKSYAYFLTRDAACRSHFCAYAGLALDADVSDPGGSPYSLGSGITARTQPAGYWTSSIVWQMRGRELTLGTSDPDVTLAQLVSVARSIVANRK